MFVQFELLSGRVNVIIESDLFMSPYARDCSLSSICHTRDLQNENALNRMEI